MSGAADTTAQQVVVLNVGQFCFIGGHAKIQTLLGSCVAVTVWHPTRRIGGMCHYLVAGQGTTGTHSADVPGLSAVQAVRLFEEAILAHGTSVKDYVVKMFGGGSMFPLLSSGEPCVRPCDPGDAGISCRDIPCRNVVFGRHLFAERGMTPSVEDVGGQSARQVIFDVWTGDVWVRRVSPATPASLT